MVKIAIIQMGSEVLNVRSNTEKCFQMLEEARKQQAQLVIFPEVVTTGYILNSRQEAEEVAEPISGTTTQRFQKYCDTHNIYCMFGLIEKTGANLYNTVVFVGPGGFLHTYRKVHLPYVAVDRFLNKGDQEFEPIKTPFGKIGILICYDCLYPEASRILALKGAELIILPTTWVEGRHKNSDLIIPARAYENKVFYLAVNKVGQERDFTFIGKSRLVDPQGDTIAVLSDQEEIQYADIDLSEARNKHIVVKKGLWEADIFQDRRPEFYKGLM